MNHANHKHIEEKVRENENHHSNNKPKNDGNDHKMNNHSHHNHSEHHGHMIEDFKKRFWISLVITIPILLLSPLVQQFLGIKQALSFNGDIYVLFALSIFRLFL